jgi:hypothetical protein
LICQFRERRLFLYCSEVLFCNRDKQEICRREFTMSFVDAYHVTQPSRCLDGFSSCKLLINKISAMNYTINMNGIIRPIQYIFAEFSILLDPLDQTSWFLVLQITLSFDIYHCLLKSVYAFLQERHKHVRPKAIIDACRAYLGSAADIGWVLPHKSLCSE